MFNYVELVKALNEISDKTSCYYCHGESLDCKTAGCYISDAADAIEELVAQNQKQEYVIRLLHIEKETFKTIFGR